MRIAYACAFVHAIATLLMATVLAPGLTGDGRLAYIASHRIAWTASWMVWQLAAITLVAMYAVFSRNAAIIGAIGAAIDITSEWRYILAGPSRTLDIAIGGFANGFYSLGLLVLLLTRRDAPRFGYFVVLAGFALSLGSFIGNQQIEIVATAILFPSFIVWAILAGRVHAERSLHDGVGT
ncbi:MAG TPA: hypothetical protein VJ901_01695 [Thermoanaerobaculia bacterium]|nr:hypothetical protein [Thermoanaerobaculia bacterium]